MEKLISGAVVRQILAAISGWWGLDGFASGDQMNAIIGAIGVLVTTGWSIWQKYNTEKQKPAV